MNVPSHFRLKSRIWFLVAYALVYAVATVVLGGATFTELYAPSPYHRLQADAMLRGELHLADSIHQIGLDLAWHDGQVHQIWGLGVGLWLLPFEALWRIFGLKWFPDRIALGFAFGLLAWYSGITAWKLAERTKSSVLGIGFVWLITLCPALWTLNQGGRLIYEETSLYACLVSLGILVSVVRVACFGGRIDFFICAGLSAMSGLVRPTHGIYGLAGMLVCSAILLARRHGTKSVAHVFNLLYRRLAAGRTSSPPSAGFKSAIGQTASLHYKGWDLPQATQSSWLDLHFLR